MKTSGSTFSVAALAGAALLAGAVQPGAVPLVSPSRGEATVLAAGNCHAVGQRIASQNGGTLAKATPDTRGGQPVCVIVVVLPAKNGQRGRRSEFVVPQE